MKYLDFFALSVLAATSGQAASITGSLWDVSNSVASNATLASIPAAAPNVTFQVSSPLNFNRAGSVDQFLLSGGATNIVGSSADLARAISPSLIEFKGLVSVTSGQKFTVTHDDGLTLIIGGLPVISAPGPTGPAKTTMTYSGPSGNLPFTLVYGECCGGQAALQISLPLQPAVPEPPSYLFAFVGGALLVVARSRLSFHKK